MLRANKYEIYMLSLINKHRDSLGLPALRLEKHLNQSANDHSKWMLSTDTFSHVGVRNSSEIDRMKAAGFAFEGDWRATENIAIQTERGTTGIMDDVRDLHIEFMNSPRHYANLINPKLEYIGIDITVGGFNYGTGDIRSVAATQNFASTKGKVALDPGNASIKYGTIGDDSLRGTRGRDDIDGYAGNDRIASGSAADTVHGGSDRDVLLGEGGNDKLYGQSGNDWILGGSGDDQMVGSTGNDRLNGGSGIDKIWSGTGNDVFDFNKGNGQDYAMDFNYNRDKLDLRDYGFETVDEALRYAEKVGKHVVFDFGDGDLLKVMNVTIAELSDVFML